MIPRFAREVISANSIGFYRYIAVSVFLFLSEVAVVGCALIISRPNEVADRAWNMIIQAGPKGMLAIPVFLIIINGTARYYMTALCNRISFGSATYIANKILRSYLAYSRPFGPNTNQNDILTLLITKVEILASGFMLSLLNFAPSLFLVSSGLIFLLLYDPSFLLFVLAYILTLWLAYYFLISPRIQSMSTTLSPAYNEAVLDIREAVEGRKELRVNRLDALQSVKSQKSLSSARMLHAKLQTLQTLPRQIIEVSIALLGFYLVTVASNPNDAAILAEYAVQFYILMRLLPQMQSFLGFLSSKSAVKSILREIDEAFPNSQQQEPSPITPVRDISLAQTLASCTDVRSIEFRNVTFCYDSRNRQLIHNLSVIFRRGFPAVIFGESGSGKSTVLDLLLGVRSPSGGEIILSDVKRRGNEAIYESIRFAVVSQRTYLFHGSVIENVCYGSDNVDRDRVIEIMSSLKLDDFCADGGKGLEYIVYDNGSNISGGEAQRLVLARALYREPDVLILDEFTSALDRSTETAVLAALNLVRHEMIIVAVSHNRRMLEFFHDCYELVDGQLGRVE